MNKFKNIYILQHQTSQVEIIVLVQSQGMGVLGLRLNISNELTATSNSRFDERI